jgi:ABC-type uncharacterized transport system ATPase subunit
MRIAYGFYTADSGELVVDGEPRNIQTPHDAIRLGIGMVHQHFMLVDTMTVAENIVLGAEPGSAAAIDLTKASEEIRALSNEFRLSVDPHALVHDLSVGQQQRVELLKALYRHARLLILDEPTAVLTPQEVEEFVAILRRMREQGKTVIIITHKLSEVLAISDDVTVMRDGRVVGHVNTAETSAAELARMMVGRDVLLRVEKPDARHSLSDPATAAALQAGTRRRNGKVRAAGRLRRSARVPPGCAARAHCRASARSPDDPASRAPMTWIARRRRESVRAAPGCLRAVHAAVAVRCRRR